MSEVAKQGSGQLAMMAREHRKTQPADRYPSSEQNQALDALLTHLEEVGPAGEEIGLALFMGMSQGPTSKRLANLAQKADPEIIAETAVAQLEGHDRSEQPSPPRTFDAVYAIWNGLVDFHKQYNGHLTTAFVARAPRILAYMEKSVDDYYKYQFQDLVKALDVPVSKEKLTEIANMLLAGDWKSESEGFCALLNLGKKGAPLANIMLHAFEAACSKSQADGHSKVTTRRPVEDALLLFETLAKEKTLGTHVPLDLKRLADALDNLIATDAQSYIDRELSSIDHLLKRVKKIRPLKKPVLVEQFQLGSM